MAGPPRRRPYPYDAVLGTTGVMLSRGKGAPLVATKTAPYDQQAPTAYSYDDIPPFVERPQPYDDLSLGFGLKIQKAFADGKYLYSINADNSVSGIMQKGPLITSLTPATTDSTNGVYRFFEFNQSGTMVLIALVGRYALIRTSDSAWSVSHDFGAGKTAVGGTVFTSSGTGTRLLFVAISGGVDYYWDGATWTPMATFTSLDYAQVGNEFWRASTINQLSKVDVNADPTVEANWGNANAFHVGDKSYPITSLATTMTGALLALKQDGIFTLDDTGQDHQLFPFMGYGATSEDGRYWGHFGNDLHVSYGQTHYRVQTTSVFGAAHLTIEEIGPERESQNDSPVKGRVTAFAGDGAHCAYAGFYNDDTGNSYLLKFGAWATVPGDSGGPPSTKRIDAWHGSISETFLGKKITALIRSTVGASLGHYRLYIGFSDGSVAWFTLPCVPNPAACAAGAQYPTIGSLSGTTVGGLSSLTIAGLTAGYQYNTNDGTINLPLWHGTFEVDAKALRSLSVLGTNLSSTNYVRFRYKNEPSQAAYTDFGTDFAMTPRQRADFPNPTPAYLADFQIVLKSTSTTSSPLVTGVVPHFAVRPSLILDYKFAVNAGDGVVKRDGRPMRLGGSTVAAAVKAAASAVGSVQLITPDEVQQLVSVVDYQEASMFDERARRNQKVLNVEAVQFKISTPYGLVSRLSAYRVQDLTGINVFQAGSL